MIHISISTWAGISQDLLKNTTSGRIIEIANIPLSFFYNSTFFLGY